MLEVLAHLAFPFPRLLNKTVLKTQTTFFLYHNALFSSSQRNF